MHRDERRAVDRIGVDLRSRRAAVAQRRERYAAVFGHEHVVEHRGVGAAAAQARAVPGVVLFQLRHRHKIEPHVGMILAVALHQPADHDPVRVAQAGAPRPAAVEPIAAGRERDFAGRRRRGGDAGCLVAAPDVVLRFFGKQRQHAGVIGEIVQAPGRGAAGRFAELDRDIESDFVVVLIAAPAFRLQRVDQSGVDEFLDRLLRDIAVALRLDRALAQLRRQRPRACDEFVGGRNSKPARRPAAVRRDSRRFLPTINNLRLLPSGDRSLRASLERRT